MATVVGAQRVVTILRRRSALTRAVDNHPVLLLHDGRVLDGALRRTGIAAGDLREEVRAALRADLFAGVRRATRLRP